MTDWQQHVREALQQSLVVRGGELQSDGEWLAPCPFHKETSGSCYVDVQRSLLHCFGCGKGLRSLSKIAQAFGIGTSVPKGSRRGGGKAPEPVQRSQQAQRPQGCTLTEYAEAKRLPVDFLADLGCSEISYCGARAIRIAYYDVDGTELPPRFRVALHGVGKLRSKKGSRAKIYGLWRLNEAQRASYAIWVEGEERAAKLVYLCMTSRLLDRPVSPLMKAQSSTGKNYVVEQTLRFFPTSAYYALTAMSERALAYSTEPLAHRMLVLYEAVGLHEGFATYLIRSLLSEGRLRYETVEKGPDGLAPRLIEREGPTGLIITTTAFRIHPENETRHISIPSTIPQNRLDGSCTP